MVVGIITSLDWPTEDTLREDEKLTSATESSVATKSSRTLFYAFLERTGAPNK